MQSKRGYTTIELCIVLMYAFVALLAIGGVALVAAALLKYILS